MAELIRLRFWATKYPVADSSRLPGFASSPFFDGESD